MKIEKQTFTFNVFFSLWCLIHPPHPLGCQAPGRAAIRQAVNGKRSFLSGRSPPASCPRILA